MSAQVAQNDVAVKKANIIKSLFSPNSKSKSFTKQMEAALTYEEFAFILNTAYTALAGLRSVDHRGYTLNQEQKLSKDIRELAGLRLEWAAKYLLSNKKNYQETVGLLNSKPRQYVKRLATEVKPSVNVFSEIKNAVVSAAIFVAIGVGVTYDFFAKLFYRPKPAARPKVINIGVASMVTGPKNAHSPSALYYEQLQGMHRDTVEAFIKKGPSSDTSTETDASSATASRGSFSTVTSLRDAAMQARQTEAARPRALTAGF